MMVLNLWVFRVYSLVLQKVFKMNVKDTFIAVLHNLAGHRA